MAVGSVDFLEEIASIELETVNLPYKGYECAQSAAGLGTTSADKVSARQSEVYKKFETPAFSEADTSTANPLDGLQWEAKLTGCRFKRLFDMLGASALILFTSPLMLLAFVLIRLQDGGASIFAQERVGLHGNVFKCLKFRSMIADAEQVLHAHLKDNPEAQKEWNDSRKLQNDPRITRLGKFLRRSSIDELPQLFNVLRGDMSLVGPRPVVPDEITRYGMQAIHYLRIRPGLTGLWQVSGRSDTSYRTRVLLDREYSLNRSFWGDISIIIRTVPAVLKSHGAV